ncbi:MAG: hypothetical protein DA407_02590 [Bacteroidetes bacterium]|nr:MAG: hypothetical protein DA407_02590 [Bacteroidota bacterium]
METGKTSKYLKYAIGEIILVMIGILLALQVNNWNEDRKNLLLEADYYCKLLEDLNQDVIEIKNQIKTNELRIKNSNILISILQKPKFTQKEVVDAMVGSVYQTSYTFKPSLAAFEDIKSSGNLGLLKDLKIKNQLISYYSILEGLIDVIDVNSDKTLESFFNYEKDFIEMGWQISDAVQPYIDATIVDVNALNPVEYPSKELTTKLMSDAIMYLGTSARKKQLYNLMEKEIKAMQQTLSEKCKS